MITSDDLAAAVGRETGNELVTIHAAQVQDQVTNAVERGSGAPPHLLAGQLVQTVLTNFQGHTQEIVHKTRLRLGDAYQFAWTPTTPEEGAAL